jgi:hypothetical protein
MAINAQITAPLKNWSADIVVTNIMLLSSASNTFYTVLFYSRKIFIGKTVI